MLYSRSSHKDIVQVLQRLQSDVRDQAGFAPDARYHPSMCLAARYDYIRQSPPPVPSSGVTVRSDAIHWHYKLLCAEASKASFKMSHLPSDPGLQATLESNPELVDRVADEIEFALQKIKTHAPLSYQRLSILVHEILPLSSGDDRLLNGAATGQGLSSAHYLGGIFIAPPRGRGTDEDLVQLMLNLMHEVGHQMLFLLQASDTLVLNPKEQVYSPVRKVSRPVLRSMHACSAAAMMLELCEEIRINGAWSSAAARQFQLHSGEQSQGLRIGLKSLSGVGLTPVGSKVCRQWIEYAA
jgi:HEXXH motif-containing protein